MSYIVGDTDPAAAAAAPNTALATTPKKTGMGRVMSYLTVSPERIADAQAVTPYIGAAAGALLWKEHRVLGLLGGLAAGSAVPSLLVKEERVDALCRLGVATLATVGSLSMPKHPVVGFVLGSVLGVAGSALVPGSKEHDGVQKLRDQMKGW